MRFEAFIEQASYGSVVALHQISLRVDPGKVVGILGANGAGKTTMIRALLNNIAAAKRTVSLGETDLSALPTWKLAQHGIGFAPDGSWCFENMSVMENLTSPFAVNEKYIERKNMQELLHEVFKLFPVLKARKSQLAGTLSGGERKMLAIGRVLMLSPKVMLLDEPSSGLAPIMVKELYKAIEAIKAAGKVAIVLTEQNAEICMKVSDYCLLLDLGKVVSEGTPEKLMANDDIVRTYFGI